VAVPARQDQADPIVARTVKAASAALGRALSEPVALTGSDWSLVVRCRDAGGGTVVVKSYPRSSRDGAACFAAEAAGLSVSDRSGLAPELLAADQQDLTVVMSDLGSWPSLADLLLGASAADARSAVLDWAARGGELAATTVLRHVEFETVKSRYLAGSPDISDALVLPERIAAAAGTVARLVATPGSGLAHVTIPAGLEAELRTVANAATPGRYPVFSPGDMCPDNNLVTDDGLRFVDFESAGIYSVFLDAAYIRMPFSTCWCVFRLPPDLTAAAESAYRGQVTRAYPELADDAVWTAGLRSAVAAWSASSLTRLLARAITSDEPLEPGRVSPGYRQLIRYRWRVLLDGLEDCGELPALAELAGSLLSATQWWQAPDLPVYPAFS
jgi:hypothetical protein